MKQKKLLGIAALMVVVAGWLYYTSPVLGPRIEAESGKIQGFKVVNDGNRSGGAYIQSSGNRRRSGEAIYTFQISQHGMYNIRAKAYGHSDNGDSFYITVGNHREMTWDVGSFDRTWRDTFMKQRRNPQVAGNSDPIEIEFMPGTFTLIIREREPNTALDYFQLEMVKPLSAASFFGGFQSSQLVQGALALCLVALSLMAIAVVNNTGWLRRSSKPVDVRLTALEKRLGDMQDVIISLDDQLKRMGSRFERSSEIELAEKD